MKHLYLSLLLIAPTGIHAMDSLQVMAGNQAYGAAKNLFSRLDRIYATKGGTYTASFLDEALEELKTKGAQGLKAYLLKVQVQLPKIGGDTRELSDTEAFLKEVLEGFNFESDDELKKFIEESKPDTLRQAQEFANQLHAHRANLREKDPNHKKLVSSLIPKKLTPDEPEALESTIALLKLIHTIDPQYEGLIQDITYLWTLQVLADLNRKLLTSWDDYTIAIFLLETLQGKEHVDYLLNAYRYEKAKRLLPHMRPANRSLEWVEEDIRLIESIQGRNPEEFSDELRLLSFLRATKTAFRALLEEHPQINDYKPEAQQRIMDQLYASLFEVEKQYFIDSYKRWNYSGVETAVRIYKENHIYGGPFNDCLKPFIERICDKTLKDAQAIMDDPSQATLEHVLETRALISVIVQRESKYGPLCNQLRTIEKRKTEEVAEN